MNKPRTIPAVLYTLLFVKSVEDFSLGENNIAQYRSIFSQEIRDQMLADLEDVLQLDPIYDYRQHMPQTTLSNEEIRALVQKIRHFVNQYHEQLTR